MVTGSWKLRIYGYSLRDRSQTVCYNTTPRRTQLSTPSRDNSSPLSGFY